MVKRQRVPVQVNQFVGGLNTEANPLSFPVASSIDEVNMDFGRDGSRIRRNGFDLEVGYIAATAPIDLQEASTLGRNQFRWENPGGYNNAEFMVVQIGNYVAVHDLNILPVSTTPTFSQTFATDTFSNTYGFASVDGILVIATGESEVHTLTYDGTDISSATSPLLIRDLFGVQSILSGVDLNAPENVQLRPVTLPKKHLYNLRNQTFALPRVDSENNLDLVDPVKEFSDAVIADIGSALYPSNADNAVKFTFADAERSSDREVERFHGQTMYKSPPSNAKAPTGYFVINALSRGASRATAATSLENTYPALEELVSGLSEDRTPGGAKVLAQYAGRVWYGGFSSEVVDGDSLSPHMSAYILFSQVVQQSSSINLCYQASDPTSIEDPDLVDTDGGFIKIDGAYNIKALIPVDSSLFVLAENGIWRVVGTDENTFTATGYSVYKISDRGCLSTTSAVTNGSSLVYWAEDGIYSVGKDDLGSWAGNNLTQDTIQTHYDSIDSGYKELAVGYYDANNTTIRWLWGPPDGSEDTCHELIFNLRYPAFTKNEVVLPAGVGGISSVVGGQSPNSALTLDVTDSLGAVVTASGESVTTKPQTIRRGVTTAYYTIILSYGNNPTYTFGRYNREDTPYDWSRLGSPTDSPAKLVTGSVSGGDARLRKDVPYLTIYFHQGGDDDLDSQCILTTQWNWSPDYTGGKWSSPRQVYRKQRDSNSGGILATRNKIRGSGRAVAFRMESVEGFGMRIYGWEFNIEATTSE